MEYESPAIIASYSEDELTAEAVVAMQYGGFGGFPGFPGFPWWNR